MPPMTAGTMVPPVTAAKQSGIDFVEGFVQLLLTMQAELAELRGSESRLIERVQATEQELATQKARIVAIESTSKVSQHSPLVQLEDPWKAAQAAQQPPLVQLEDTEVAHYNIVQPTQPQSQPPPPPNAGHSAPASPPPPPLTPPPGASASGPPPPPQTVCNGGQPQSKPLIDTNAHMDNSVNGQNSDLNMIDKYLGYLRQSQDPDYAKKVLTNSKSGTDTALVAKAVEIFDAELRAKALEKEVMDEPTIQNTQERHRDPLYSDDPWAASASATVAKCKQPPVLHQSKAFAPTQLAPPALQQPKCPPPQLPQAQSSPSGLPVKAPPPSVACSAPTNGTVLSPPTIPHKAPPSLPQKDAEPSTNAIVPPQATPSGTSEAKPTPPVKAPPAILLKKAPPPQFAQPAN